MDGRREEFAEQGLVLAPELISRTAVNDLLGEVETLLEASDYHAAQNLRCRYALYPESGEQLLDALDPVVDICATAAAIAGSENLRGILSELYSEPACLFKDKYFLRQAGAPGYPPHQDFIAWPFFPRTFTTVLIALDPISANNGGLEFYAGSHKKGLLTKADGDFHTIATSELREHQKVSLELAPGDAVIFNAFVVHESSRNRSTRPRRSLYLSYNAASDGGDQRSAHYRYFHSWLKRRFGEYGEDKLFFK